jgi:GNAT superfamily N-acetyltransferase
VTAPAPTAPGDLADAYRVEPVGASALPEVDALFNLNYPWKAVPDGFAAWRYASAEARGACLGARPRSGGPLVGAYGLELLRASGPDGPLLLGLVADVVVHPRHQRRGLGAWLEQAAAERARAAGCAFLLCFPNPKLAALHGKGSAWLTAAHTRAFERPAAPPFGPTDRPPAEASATPPAGGGALWRELRRRGTLGPGSARDEKFLDWRFARHPRNRYTFLSDRGPHGLAGFAAVKVWTDPFTGERVGDVVDLLAGEEGVAADLLAEACRRLSLAGVSHYTLWAPAALSDATLAGLGFGPSPAHTRPVHILPLRDDTSRGLEGWSLTQADSDIY